MMIQQLISPRDCCRTFFFFLKTHPEQCRCAVLHNQDTLANNGQMWTLRLKLLAKSFKNFFLASLSETTVFGRPDTKATWAC